GTVVAVAANLGLKQVFTETRPCDALAHVVTVQPCPGLTDYSFPSNHTTIATALALGVFLINRRLGAIAIVLAALEGFSRVYLGQHYPHDVIAAAFISSTLMLLGWPVVRNPLTGLLRWAERTPLRPLLTSAESADTAPAPTELHHTTAG
ncbi:MAG: phosphatase PAP2 family protein, partial [Catenulispora sp.]|nr:phosphatase PAP2 family protein [Catenulispora sp.]